MIPTRQGVETVKQRPIAGYGLILLLLAIAFPTLTNGSLAWRAANASPATTLRPAQPSDAIIFGDGSFQLSLWEISAQITGNASYTASRQQSGGNPDAFLFMSHRLPPVTGDDLFNRVAVTYIYQAFTHRPTIDGRITSIDYEEDGIILSFPVPDAFSTTIPVLQQNGRLFRAEPFLRFVAQDGAHSWETKALTGLTARHFFAVDGSGDHPDFDQGTGIHFGFIRTNSRTPTLPPFPSDQDLVIDQGVDNWRITIHRDSSNRPPRAVDDIFVLDGNNRTLPIIEFLDVLRNDRDPDPYDRLEVVDVTSPLYGTASLSTRPLIAYSLHEARVSDNFSYTISDGELTSSAGVQLYFDCACTVFCLSYLTLPASPAAQASGLDLPLIYRLRDQIMKPTPDGHRYVDMYYSNNPEILVKTLTNEALRTGALATVELWQDNLRSLVDGDGSALITQAQVDAAKSFLDNLWLVGSDDLRQLIGDELERLGPLDGYVGMTMIDAKRRAIGDPLLYVPLLLKQ
jgi:hypothetical protein